jgi:hypothetical protein
VHRCFLYFLEDGSGQLSEFDKLTIAPNSIGTVAVSATGNLALSPSDDVTELFGSTGDKLVRINVYDGSTTQVADISGIEVNDRAIGDIFNRAFLIGIGLQSRRWLHLHDEERLVCALLH